MAPFLGGSAAAQGLRCHSTPARLRNIELRTLNADCRSESHEERPRRKRASRTSIGASRVSHVSERPAASTDPHATAPSAGRRLPPPSQQLLYFHAHGAHCGLWAVRAGQGLRRVRAYRASPDVPRGTWPWRAVPAHTDLTEVHACASTAAAPPAGPLKLRKEAGVVPPPPTPPPSRRASVHPLCAVCCAALHGRRALRAALEGRARRRAGTCSSSTVLSVQGRIAVQRTGQRGSED